MTDREKERLEELRKEQAHREHQAALKKADQPTPLSEEEERELRRDAANPDVETYAFTKAEVQRLLATLDAARVHPATPGDLRAARKAIEALTTWPRVSWFAYDARVRGEPVNPTEDRVVVDRAEVLAIIDAALAVPATEDGPTEDEVVRLREAAQAVVDRAHINQERRDKGFDPLPTLVSNLEVALHAERPEPPRPEPLDAARQGSRAEYLAYLVGEAQRRDLRQPAPETLPVRSVAEPPREDRG